MSGLSRFITYALGLAALTCLASSTVFAGGIINFPSAPFSSPEIDGSTLFTGLGLLTAGALIVRSRMSK